MSDSEKRKKRYGSLIKRDKKEEEEEKEKGMGFLKKGTMEEQLKKIEKKQGKKKFKSFAEIAVEKRILPRVVNNVSKSTGNNNSKNSVGKSVSKPQKYVKPKTEAELNQDKKRAKIEDSSTGKFIKRIESRSKSVNQLIAEQKRKADAKDKAAKSKPKESTKEQKRKEYMENFPAWKKAHPFDDDSRYKGKK